jgi:hypothetical protein
MSGRFVRASKYRHVHGDEPKKDGAYVNLRPQCTGDGNFVAASTKFGTSCARMCTRASSCL